MDLSQLPLHIVTDIISNVLEQESLAAGLRLRLVCQQFNREVLYAFFNLQAPKFRQRWPYGHIIPFDDLAMVRYLHGLTMRKNAHLKLKGSHGHWLRTIEQGAKALQTLVPDLNDITLMHEQHHGQKASVEPRGSPEWVYRRIVCESIVRFLGPEECFTSILCDEVASTIGTPNLCILNRPIDFWVVVVSCHIGRLSAVDHAITNLRRTVEGNRDWRVHLNGCMYVAARNGHVDVVRQLIEMGLDVNSRAYRGFQKFIAGDGTPLSGATKFGSLEIVELLLAQDVIKQGPEYEWAIDACLKRDSGVSEEEHVTRRAIVRRLREEGTGTVKRKERIISRAFPADLETDHLPRMGPERNVQNWYNRPIDPRRSLQLLTARHTTDVLMSTR